MNKVVTTVYSVDSGLHKIRITRFENDYKEIHLSSVSDMETEVFIGDLGDLSDLKNFIEEVIEEEEGE